jgi:phosphoglycerate dehydrogenase-like enzyme
MDEVLVTWAGYDDAGPSTGGRLLAAGLQPRLAPKTGPRSALEVVALVRGAVGAIVSTDPFDAGVFAAAPQLRVVARVGVGTDSIDLVAATAAGVVVTVTPGANQETTADHAVALILAGVRRVVEHDAAVRRGEWPRGGELTPWDLFGATVGLVGYGAIGKAVGKRLAGFGVELLVADPAVEPAPEATVVELEELLRRAQVVSLHAPLTSGTRALIGAEQLALMRADAILVNTSRGGLVDEVALAQALAARSIRAAALDVFSDEPAVPRALLADANVTVTPHIGGLSQRSIERMTALATDSVLRVLDGDPDPATVANPAVLEGGRAAA